MIPSIVCICPICHKTTTLVKGDVVTAGGHRLATCRMCGKTFDCTDWTCNFEPLIVRKHKK